jgi:hypothetical protein
MGLFVGLFCKKQPLCALRVFASVVFPCPVWDRVVINWTHFLPLTGAGSMPMMVSGPFFGVQSVGLRNQMKGFISEKLPLS